MTLTFSKEFPAYHPKAGQPTYFVEKIWASLVDQEIELPEFWFGWFRLNNSYPFDGDNFSEMERKDHTIRAGNRWKVGDKFSPRIWMDKPYRSKQLIFAPEIEVKKVWDFEMVSGIDEVLQMPFQECFVDGKPVSAEIIAKNDGLELSEILYWFNKPFKGQIICWNENINY